MDEIILMIHTGATLYMVGLIWFVQLVHYPLFAAVGEDGYARYHQAHMARTGWAVGPAMLMEAFTALWLALLLEGHQQDMAWIGLGLVMFIWMVTALFSVPAHGRLAQAFDPVVHKRLVQTNWLRTVGWSARGILALMMIH